MLQQDILVTGATGFVGRAVVPLLLEQGYRVRALTRGSWPFPDHPYLQRVQGDLRDRELLHRALGGVGGVIHLAARKADEPDSEAVNVDGARYLIEACRAHRVGFIINISTQSARLRRRGPYGETKAQADRMFAESGLPVTTFRCSLVYGDRPEGAFAGILRFARLPIVPIIGSGETHFRPIHVDDLARAIARAVEAVHARGKTYDVGGPEELTFQEILDRILKKQHLRRPRLHLPIPLALLLARILSVLPRPPLTVSNVLGAAEDLRMDISPFIRDFLVPLRSFQEGLDRLFPPSDATAAEARALLSYVGSACRPRIEPDDGMVRRYGEAVRALDLEWPRLSSRLLRRRWLLGVLDARTRLAVPQCLLQRKLLVAAAVLECHPSSAPALLPRDRSVLGIAAACGIIAVRVLLRWASTLLLLPFPRFVRRHGGY